MIAPFITQQLASREAIVPVLKFSVNDWALAVINAKSIIGVSKNVFIVFVLGFQIK